MAVARKGLKDVLANVRKFRLGLTIFDDGGNGVVLTSIHGRSDARTYAKNVTGWTGQQFSPEEAQAVGAARERGASVPLTARSAWAVPPDRTALGPLASRTPDKDHPPGPSSRERAKRPMPSIPPRVMSPFGVAARAG